MGRMTSTFDTFTRNDLMDAFAGLNFGTGNLMEAMESVRRKRRKADAGKAFSAAELRAALAGKLFGEDFADSIIEAMVDGRGAVVFTSQGPVPAIYIPVRTDITPGKISALQDRLRYAADGEVLGELLVLPPGAEVADRPTGP
jgi:hypothetical protein